MLLDSKAGTAKKLKCGRCLRCVAKPYRKLLEITLFCAVYYYPLSPLLILSEGGYLHLQLREISTLRLVFHENARILNAPVPESLLYLRSVAA